MKWDDVALAILAGSGCITLLLTEISDALSKLREVIRAWHQVRQELHCHALDLTHSDVQQPADSFSELHGS
jgi:hypothetical protein